MTNVTRVSIFSADNYGDLVIPLTSDGVAQPLDGCTQQVRLKNLATGVVTSGGGSIDTPASAGIVRRPWASVDEVTTTEEFEYLVQVRVTFANGKVQTFPDPDSPELRVRIVPAAT